MGKSGRLVVPATFRRALDLKPGTELIVRLTEDGLHISTRRQAIAHAQEIVRAYVPAERRLVDELLAERRESAERE